MLHLMVGLPWFACGLPQHPAKMCSTPRGVDCKNCQNTLRFREAVAEEATHLGPWFRLHGRGTSAP